MGKHEKMTILCVDDEPNILRSLQRFFRKDNFQVLTAESAHEALGIFEELGPVQVLISDFQMPGQNGVELIKQVKFLFPQTVSILLSGFSDLSMVSPALDDQLIFRHVAKPWDRKELRQTVFDAVQVYATDTCMKSAC